MYKYITFPKKLAQIQVIVLENYVVLRKASERQA